MAWLASANDVQGTATEATTNDDLAGALNPSSTHAQAANATDDPQLLLQPDVRHQ
jgi:hypothetical protein